jgi:hypothetical protein
MEPRRVTEVALESISRDPGKSSIDFLQARSPAILSRIKIEVYVRHDSGKRKSRVLAFSFRFLK